MRRGPIYLFTVVAFWCNPADGGSPDYCRPYARDLTQVMINYIWNRAYSTCLNVEGPDPTVPDNWQDAWKIVDPQLDKIGAEIDAALRLDKKKLSKIGVVPATADPTPDNEEVAALPTLPKELPPKEEPPPEKPLKKKSPKVQSAGKSG